MALLGSTPIGGPLVGWIGEHVSPRLSLLVGGAAALLAAAYGFASLARHAQAADATVVTDHRVEHVRREPLTAA
jgi:hypothetical protein